LEPLGSGRTPVLGPLGDGEWPCGTAFNNLSPPGPQQFDNRAVSGLSIRNVQKYREV